MIRVTLFEAKVIIVVWTVEFLEPGLGFLFKAIERVMKMAQKIEVH